MTCGDFRYVTHFCWVCIVSYKNADDLTLTCSRVALGFERLKTAQRHIIFVRSSSSLALRLVYAPERALSGLRPVDERTSAASRTYIYWTVPLGASVDLIYDLVYWHYAPGSKLRSKIEINNGSHTSRSIPKATRMAISLIPRSHSTNGTRDINFTLRGP